MSTWAPYQPLRPPSNLLELDTRKSFPFRFIRVFQTGMRGGPLAPINLKICSTVKELLSQLRELVQGPSRLICPNMKITYLLVTCDWVPLGGCGVIPLPGDISLRPMVVLTDENIERMMTSVVFFGKGELYAELMWNTEDCDSFRIETQKHNEYKEVLQGRRQANLNQGKGDRGVYNPNTASQVPPYSGWANWANGGEARD
ncbi:MAG: hypothetical protein M1814_004847 [Vezdaea aestivalis]|nr:MAG: hypothetical protein M1814_004847 [Vezdaea aestivalis]